MFPTNPPKKFWILLFLLALAVAPLHAAEVVYSDDFEVGHADWWVDNGVWQVGSPQVGPPSCHSGSQCAGTLLESNYSNSTDSRLASYSLRLPDATGDEEIHMRFWQWFSYSSYDGGIVQVSVWDDVNGGWSEWETLNLPITDISTVWTVSSVELTQFAGKKIRVGFFHQAGSPPNDADARDNSSGWYVDDVEIFLR